MKNLVLFLLAATMLCACKKDNDENKFDLDEFFAQHKPQEQVFTFSADSSYWKKVTGSKGAVIEFNTGPLVGGVTGNVTMKLTEVYSKSEAILSGLNTVDNNGKPLKSAGMMRLTFETGSGQRTAPVGNIKITVPAMDDYYQGSDFYMLAPLSGSGNTFAWSAFASTANIIDSCASSACNAVITFYNSNFLIDYDWINCDTPVDTPYTELSVNIITGTQNPLTYYTSSLVLKNAMAIYTLDNFVSGNTLQAQYAPLGEPVTYIVVAEDDEGIVYFGKKEFTITANMTVDVSLSPTTEAALLTEIEALD